METNINYSVVGAFVITLVAATVLAIIWLSSGFSFEIYATYKVLMQESVSGLNIDSVVEYNGVNVGSVKSIKLDTKDPHQVDLLLSIKSDTPITMGTTATMTSRGVTGITYIALKDKSDDLRPLLALKGEQYPIIKTAPSFFLRLDTALNKLSENLEKVSITFQSVFDQENQRAIKATLKNMQIFTATLADNTQKLTTILENTSRASHNLAPMMMSTTSAMTVLQNQTLPATYRLLSNMNDAARTLSEVSAEIKQNPSILIRGINRQPLGPGEKQ